MCSRSKDPYCFSYKKYRVYVYNLKEGIPRMRGVVRDFGMGWDGRGLLSVWTGVFAGVVSGLGVGFMRQEILFGGKIPK